jgi:hypothetical protein
MTTVVTVIASVMSKWAMDMQFLPKQGNVLVYNQFIKIGLHM